MITEMPRDELIATGRPLRAEYLVEQAGYTLGVAALDGKGLEAELPEGYLGEVREVLAAVEASRQDKALMAAESGEATKGQNRALKAAKVWRRKVSKRASGASRMGKPLPEGLLRISQARTQPELAAQVVEMTGLLEANLGFLHGQGLEALLQEGKDLGRALQATDAAQEVKRLKELPDSVKEFWAQKGRLYIGLKVIHDAGQGLHADSAPLSSRYNLSILHRHAGKGAPSEPEAPKSGAGG